MRVGHGARDLEVVPGEGMGGYADRSQGVEGVLDPLEVHVLTFADDAHRFALVVADLICVNTDIVDRIRAGLLDLGVDSCWVSATHTHASPEAGCTPGGAATPPGLGVRLLEATVAAAKTALADEQDAALAHTRAWVPKLAGRRNADDTAPMEIPVDMVVVADDDVVGVITISPVHPTVLPAANRDVSADLNGGIRRSLATPHRWAVAVTGAAGDISTRHTRAGRSAAEIDRLAAVVASHVQIEAHGEYESRRNAVRPPVSRTVRLEPKSAADVDGLPDEPPGAPTDERTRVVYEQGLQLARDLAARGRVDDYVVDVQAVGLGDVTLVAVPAELFLALGESIRAATGPDVIVLGYTNGYLGYLPSRDTPPTYETLVSPVRPGSGERVADAAVRAVQAVRRSEERE